MSSKPSIGSSLPSSSSRVELSTSREGWIIMLLPVGRGGEGGEREEGGREREQEEGRREVGEREEGGKREGGRREGGREGGREEREEREKREEVEKRKEVTHVGQSWCARWPLTRALLGIVHVLLAKAHQQRVGELWRGRKGEVRRGRGRGMGV